MFKPCEQDIQNFMYQRLIHNAWMLLPNIYINWEMDLCKITASDYVYEYEIKTSVQDFKADFKKSYRNIYKHDILSAKVFRRNYMVPKHFYYVCPKNIINHNDIPEYAGHIEIEFTGPNRGYLETTKKAPVLKNCKKISDKLKIKLLRNMSFRYWKMKLEGMR